jgi:hypothetical protein
MGETIDFARVKEVLRQEWGSIEQMCDAQAKRVRRMAFQVGRTCEHQENCVIIDQKLSECGIHGPDELHEAATSLQLDRKHVAILFIFCDRWRYFSALSDVGNAPSQESLNVRDTQRNLRKRKLKGERKKEKKKR